MTQENDQNKFLIFFLIGNINYTRCHGNGVEAVVIADVEVSPPSVISEESVFFSISYTRDDKCYKNYIELLTWSKYPSFIS